MITMRPGYETADYHGGQPHPGWITETLANGHTLMTMAGTAAARERYGARGLGRQRVTQEGRTSAGLQRALNSSDPAVALRARKLQMLMLAAG
jgi:hypothetical protein